MQETETLVQNLDNTITDLVNSFDENQAKMQENENDFITLNGTIHDNFVRIKVFENHVQDLNELQDTVQDLNNTVMDNLAKIKGMYIRSTLIHQIGNLFYALVCNLTIISYHQNLFFVTLNSTL